MQYRQSYRPPQRPAPRRLPLDARLLLVLPASWGVALLLNAGFLRFLARKGGARLAAVGAGLHLLHLAAVSVGMLLGIGAAIGDLFRRGATRPAAAPPAGAKGGG